CDPAGSPVCWTKYARPCSEKEFTEGFNGSRNSPTRAVWNCSRRVTRVCDIDVPTLPPSLRRRAIRPTAAARRWTGVYLKAATFSETKIIDRPTINTTRGQMTCEGLMDRFISAIQ